MKTLTKWTLVTSFLLGMMDKDSIRGVTLSKWQTLIFTFQQMGSHYTFIYLNCLNNQIICLLHKKKTMRRNLKTKESQKNIQRYKSSLIFIAKVNLCFTAWYYFSNSGVEDNISTWENINWYTYFYGFQHMTKMWDSEISFLCSSICRLTWAPYFY